jgi:1,4-dihydroxy-2-naphthoate octaprenyltransferase
MMIAFYLIVIGLVLSGEMGVWVLLVVLAARTLFRVLKAYSQPKPSEPPPDYPVWPLWFVSLAFVHTRWAGALFMVGLILNLIAPMYIGG